MIYRYALYNHVGPLHFSFFFFLKSKISLEGASKWSQFALQNAWMIKDSLPYTVLLNHTHILFTVTVFYHLFYSHAVMRGHSCPEPFKCAKV